MLRILLLGVLDMAGVFASIAELHVLQDDGDVVVLPSCRANKLNPGVASNKEGLRGFALYLAMVNLQRQGCGTWGQLGSQQSQGRERLKFSCLCPGLPYPCTHRHAQPRVLTQPAKAGMAVEGDLMCSPPGKQQINLTCSAVMLQTTQKTGEPQGTEIPFALGPCRAGQPARMDLL